MNFYEEKIWPFLARCKMWSVDLNLKIAVKTAIAASISLILGLAFTKVLQRPDSLVSGLWSVMASIVVMQAYLGGTYRTAWVRFLGVFVGSISGAIVLSNFGDHSSSLAVGVFFTIVMCSLLKIKESFRIASMSSAVIIVLGGLHPEINPWIFSLFRFLDSCIGILVAVFVAMVIWPEKAVENLRNNTSKVLILLSQYYRMASNSVV